MGSSALSESRVAGASTFVFSVDRLFRRYFWLYVLPLLWMLWLGKNSYTMWGDWISYFSNDGLIEATLIVITMKRAKGMYSDAFVEINLLLFGQYWLALVSLRSVFSDAPSSWDSIFKCCGFLRRPFCEETWPMVRQNSYYRWVALAPGPWY